MYLFRQAKKVVRAPEENWQEKINTGFEEWAKEMKDKK